MFLGSHKSFYRYHDNLLHRTTCSYLLFNLTQFIPCLLERSIKIVLIFSQSQCCLYSITAIYMLLPIVAHKEAQCLSCSTSYRTAHLLCKYCTNCTLCNWTVLTVITQKLLLHVQLHNSTETVQLMSPEVQCRRLFDITSIYKHVRIRKLNPSKNSDNSKRTATTSQHYATQTYVAVRWLPGG